MRQAWLDLGVDICLDLGPFFRFCRGVFWDLGTEVAWFDCWDDAPGGEGVEVVYYYLGQYLGELEELGWGVLLSSMAACDAVRNCSLSILYTS